MSATRRSLLHSNTCACCSSCSSCCCSSCCCCACLHPTVALANVHGKIHRFRVRSSATKQTTSVPPANSSRVSPKSRVAPNSAPSAKRTLRCLKLSVSVEVRSDHFILPRCMQKVRRVEPGGAVNSTAGVSMNSRCDAESQGNGALIPAVRSVLTG